MLRAWLLERFADIVRGEDVPIGRSHPRVKPVRHLDELDEFRGMWVAVLNGRVVEAAESSRELAYRLRQRDLSDATVEYVPPPSEGIRIGVG